MVGGGQAGQSAFSFAVSALRWSRPLTPPLMIRVTRAMSSASLAAFSPRVRQKSTAALIEPAGVSTRSGLISYSAPVRL